MVFMAWFQRKTLYFFPVSLFHSQCLWEYEGRVTSLLLSLTANIVHTLKLKKGTVFQIKGTIDPWTLLL